MGPVRDLLTGLAGRGRLVSAPAVGAVLHVDLDRFSDVNYQHGYAVADQVLVQFAARLGELTGPDDVLLRLGADEFAVLLPAPGSVEHLRTLAERVVERAAAPFVVLLPGHGPVEVRLGASVGLSRTDRGHHGDVDQLMREADLAMRQAKSRGRGTVGGPAPDAAPPRSHPSRSPHVIERRLRLALDRGDLQVHFQPIVSLPDGQVVAHEALARWTDDELGPVGPDEFIPVAERGGMVTDLGLWVLERSCRTATTWPAGPGGLAPAVAVNVSAVQLAQARFGDDVLEVLRATGLPGHRLCLEITETSDVTDMDLAVATLARLRVEGVRTALDDFGTGRAALSVMRRLPLDVVKIDRGFVEGLAHDATDAVMVRSLVDAAHHLGLEVCAEGVEDHDQARALVALGVDRAQGWLFGRPTSDACEATAAAVDVDGLVDRAHGVDEFVAVVDREGVVRFASSGARAVLGQEVRPAGSVLRLVQPDDVVVLAGLVTGAGAGSGDEATVRTADDVARPGRWLRVRAQAFRRPGAVAEEVVLSCRDVSDRVQAQTDAAVLDHVLHATIDVAPVAIAVSDLDGRILRSNQAFASLLGRRMDDVVGRTVQQLTYPLDLVQDVVNLEAARSGQQRQVVAKRYLHADGTPVPAVCEVRVVLGPEGTPVAVVAHVRPA